MRKIVNIDENKCDGCGACVISCAEGALQVIDGKARLISETYCDGLGNCLSCPQGAITVEEREAQDFDATALEQHLNTRKVVEKPACACLSATMARFGDVDLAPDKTPAQKSRLRHWPVQLALVPPTAPFFKGADLLVAAHCVPFAYAGFHADFLKENTALVVACPKLDDFKAHQEKLGEILKQSDVKSLAVVHMEVPCCSGLTYLARQSILASGKAIPLKEIIITIKGERKAG